MTNLYSFSPIYVYTGKTYDDKMQCIESCEAQQIYTGVSDSKKINIRRYCFAGKRGIDLKILPFPAFFYRSKNQLSWAESDWTQRKAVQVFI